MVAATSESVDSNTRPAGAASALVGVAAKSAYGKTHRLRQTRPHKVAAVVTAGLAPGGCARGGRPTNPPSNVKSGPGAMAAGPVAVVMRNNSMKYDSCVLRPTFSAARAVVFACSCRDKAPAGRANRIRAQP